MLTFAATIGLSAFLLFQVQPILGKVLVPRFGGGAGVWTTCMLFFQVLLLGGYAYAHLLASRLGVRSQALLHVALLLASAVFLPLAAPPAVDASAASGSPTTGILILLLVQVGLPYLLLSSTGPLLQAWFARTYPGRSPYRLYALSNLGSLLGLLSYPFVFEPQLTVSVQGLVWTGGYAAFALFCIASAWRLDRAAGAGAAAPPASPNANGSERPGALRIGLWLMLAAVGSMALLGATNALTQDLAAMPLLWIAPLSIYLLTFIICFDRAAWYDRRVFVPMFALLAGIVLVFGDRLGVQWIWLQVAAHCGALFAACMVCHGELVRSKPDPRHLTLFYLMVAAGGAVGGLVVAVVAPAVLTDYWEYPIALLLAGLLALLAISRERPQAARGARWPMRAGIAAGALLLVGGGVSVAREVAERDGQYVLSRRNFYGAVHVQEGRDHLQRPLRQLIHGRTIHGTRFLDDQLKDKPTSYYGLTSGVGLAIAALRKPAPGDDSGPRRLKIGVLGLGIGALVAQTRAGDVVRFYEINPVVHEIAEQHFGWLREARAKVDVVIGDGRLVLERELETGPQHFDLLVVDAFNSDSVPIHLLTREAFAIYAAHLHPDTGALAYNVTNRHLDLVPVVLGLARDAGYSARVIAAAQCPSEGCYGNTWVLVSNNPGVIDDAAVVTAADQDERLPDSIRWTDDFASLVSVLSHNGYRGQWYDAPNSGRFVLDLAGWIDPDTERSMTSGLQQLYRDTDGWCSVMIAVMPHVLPEYRVLSDGWSQYVRDLFHEFGLGEMRSRRGVLCVVAVADSRMEVFLGDGWGPKTRDRAKALLQTELVPRVNAGETSAGFAAIAGALEAMSREAYARYTER